MVRLSVIVPVYNGLPFVKQAVESVLGQTYRDFEFLILNDASTDGSGEYLDGIGDSRVRVVHCEKQGYVRLLNRGLEEARGELVARMDADDVCLPERFERQMAVMAADKGLVICGCQAALIDEQGQDAGRYEYPLSDAGIRFELLTRCAFLHPGVVYRRQAVLDVGGYGLETAPCDDYELWGRLSAAGRMANCSEALVQYRVHGKNVSFVQQEARDRITRRVAVRQIVGAGVADSEEGALEYIGLKRKTQPDQINGLSVAEGEAFCHYVERFLERYERDWGGSDGASEVRRMVRWRFLHRAKLCRVTSREYRAWIGLAARIDPEEMRLSRVLRRAVSSATRRVLVGVK